jgi:hypothetical protein
MLFATQIRALADVKLVFDLNFLFFLQAALMGGCAAQEAIKLITKQYVPINNLFIFNTMTMASLNLKIG